jgi:hypothetical protein
MASLAISAVTMLEKCSLANAMDILTKLKEQSNHHFRKKNKVD